ncbi:hypothetical protein [Lactovum odontotermitis]
MYKVTASNAFWRSGLFLRKKYSAKDYREIMRTIREVINELAENGTVNVNGWDEHILIHHPFADENHFECHIFDDDVLLVYFKREAKHVIRMVGIFDHETLPNSKK